MPLQPVKLQPGIDKENTQYTNKGRWWDMDKVRFRTGTPEKIGGWVKFSANSFLGTARHLWNWVTLAGENLLSVGTNLKMYIARSGAFYDITPIRATFTHATTASTDNCFTTGTGAGLTTITVTIGSHGAITGDFVTFTGATAVDGVTVSGEYQIALGAPAANVFTITVPAYTGTGLTGGGTAITAAFQINTGSALTTAGLGWGVSAYGGTGAVPTGWGVAASGGSAVSIASRQWSGYNFGQDFVCGVRGAGIYYWSALGAIGAALSQRAIPLSSASTDINAPIIGDMVVVDDNEILIVVGSNPLGQTYEDPMTVRWSDQGAALIWTPDITNQAGDVRLTAGSYTVAVEKLRQENMIWTDSALISMQYIGPPLVYSFKTVATNLSIASTNAVATANSTAYWMGHGKFYKYDGSVSTLQCPIRKFIFDNINSQQLGQVYASTNKQFNEITWFYCSASSQTPDSYVTYNHGEDIWSYGTLTRSAWLDSGTQPNPLGAGLDGYLYYHEDGIDDGSTTPVSAIDSYIESADFEIGDGDQYSFISRILPDVDFSGSTAAVPEVTLTLKTRDNPGSNIAQHNDSAVAQTAVVPYKQFTQYSYVRLRGRQVLFRIESNQVGVQWQLGTPRLEIRPDGGR
jgi:hypothetical protein